MLVGKGLSCEQAAATVTHETWGDTHTVRHPGTPSNLGASPKPRPFLCHPPTAPPSHSFTQEPPKAPGGTALF